jgi:hypothetical protein
MKEFANEELTKEVLGKFSSRPFDGDVKNEDSEDDEEEKELPLVAGNGVDSSFLLKPVKIVFVALACLLENAQNSSIFF